MMKQLIYHTNMAGNFNLLKMDKNLNYIVFFILLVLLTSCNKETSEDIGRDIINQNLPIILDSIDKYYTLTDEILLNKEKRQNTIKIENYVSYDSFFFEECEFCQGIMRNDRLNVDSMYFTKFKINNIPIKKIDGYNIVLVKPNKGFYGIRKTIEISLNNLYIYKNQKKAFLVVDKIAANSKGGKTEIYFFLKKGNKWKFYEKKLLFL